MNIQALKNNQDPGILAKARAYVAEFREYQLRGIPKPGDDDYSEEDAKEEVTHLANFLEDAISLAYQDASKVFEILNSGFRYYMKEKANSGVLFRQTLEDELHLFEKISNVVRGAMSSKMPLINAQCHYEGLKYDIEKLIKISNEQENERMYEHLSTELKPKL